MIKCTICGKTFTPKKELRYEVPDADVASELFSSARHVMECFDCPRCGCQMNVNTRTISKLPKINCAATTLTDEQKKVLTDRITKRTKRQSGGCET